ncbi:MAG TPA: hypothetical protein VGZ33_06925, partial [Acidimicrobiales bacterium]|nr:hypothetical protein [Acidimicrobiales bacterium]
MANEPLELRTRTDPSDEDVAITIECDRCVRQDSTACGGCLVSFVLDRSPGDAVIIDADEARALRVLADAGL